MDYRQHAFEKQLKSMFDKIDDDLEDKFNGNYRLHPNRSKRGTTSNKESDGLFNVGVAFSLGYGSKYGRGYVLDLSLSTLQRIPFGVKRKFYKNVYHLIVHYLPIFFPSRDLEIVKDGNIYKIIGDFTLGDVIS